jgi:hypothetical protein
MRTAKDWGQPCPNPNCTQFHRINCGNISAIATYMTQSGKRRIFRCLRMRRELLKKHAKRPFSTFVPRRIRS